MGLIHISAKVHFAKAQLNCANGMPIDELDKQDDTQTIRLLEAANDSQAELFSKSLWSNAKTKNHPAKRNTALS